MLFKKIKQLRISDVGRYFFSIPNTIYFNFHYFPLKIAMRLPVIVSSKTKLAQMGGQIILNCDEPPKTGMIRIGFGNIGIFDYNFSRTIWENNGCIVFSGGANICQGCKVSCGTSGVLTFGKNFTCTAESQFVCVDKITFGDDCLISWENLIMDTDWHQVLSSKKKNNHAPINIGNHVWVGCRCTILKGVDIPDNSVVAAGSIVKKRFLNANSLIAGNDARQVAAAIDWQP